MIALRLHQRWLPSCGQRLTTGSIPSKIEVTVSIRYLTTATATTATATTATITTRTPTRTIVKRRKRSRQQSNEQQQQQQHKQKMTTKDRIRLLERNPLENDGIIMAKKSAIQAASFLETRLLQAQTLVKEFWTRGDSNHERPEMDRWWWAWNICFALTPAAMIVVYMELWGIKAVEDRSMDLELYRRKKAGLLDDFANDDTDDDIGNDDESNTQADTLPFTVSPSSTSVPLQQSSPDPMDLPPEELSSQVSTPADATITTDPAVTELYRRIDLLEKKLERQKHRMAENKRLQRQRMNQSGIKNRVEDKFRLKEIEKRNKESTSTGDVAAAEAASPPTAFTVMQVYMQQRLQSKLDAMRDFGLRILSSSADEDSTKDEAEVEPATKPTRFAKTQECTEQGFRAAIDAMRELGQQLISMSRGEDSNSTKEDAEAVAGTLPVDTSPSGSTMLHSQSVTPTSALGRPVEGDHSAA